MAIRSRTLGITRLTLVLHNLVSALRFITLLVAAVAFYLCMNLIVEWGRVWSDDLHYGRPRTTHVEGFVGHSAEGSGHPTRFIAMNLDRQVIILELPGGDATQVRHLPGPYLFGAREDLTPVLLTLRDVDGDGQDDLVATIRNEEIVYLNRDEGFRLPHAAEQLQFLEE
ncbi:hypothetical protein [Candidatus Viridilinea mediisalina]|uniref:VCBS repeat-containing protein n=1 Tax=Candidatus Viridilinea mediisalina TaxID=2024553 RepID=A0A2A6RK96_9CHLR|nr:hypothetical protein [Candidatus Viridilinea mediisalina]PDW03534.1 hypothetical protein CJ255_08175 [Candidatus Viridilinea mediisalina]